MPKCVKCLGVFPPEFSSLIPVTDLKGDQPHRCLFCEMDIKAITVEKGNGREQYTREQCIKDYDVFLKKVKEKRSVSLLLKGQKIIP